YEETRQAVLDAADWFDDELPWAETDDKGDLVPGTDTEERFLGWLNSPLDPENDRDFELLTTWGERESTQYAPGFALMRSLPPEDVQRLGLAESDLGGPASYVPCVSTHASREELNAAIAAHDLPFVVIDEEGSEEE